MTVENIYVVIAEFSYEQEINLFILHYPQSSTGNVDRAFRSTLHSPVAFPETENLKTSFFRVRRRIFRNEAS
jgi:hypothetical protein